MLTRMRYQDALEESNERLDFPPTPPKAPESAPLPRAKPTLRVIQGGLAAASFVLLVVPAIAQDFYSQCIRNPNEQRNAYVLQTNLGAYCKTLAASYASAGDKGVREMRESLLQGRK